MMIQEQLFGVEIEMTGICRRKAAETVAEVLESEVKYHDFSVYDKREIEDGKGRVWTVMRDASIESVINDGENESYDSYKVELVTPPLNYGDIELLQTVVRKLKENGAVRHNSCGIHVHVDGSNHNAASIRRLLNFIANRQDLIYEALGIGERADHWCRKINPEMYRRMKECGNITKEEAENIWYSRVNDGYCGGEFEKSYHYNPTRYHGINLHSYFTKGTIEFRLFNSTLHAGKIKAYIQFCLAMSAWAINSSDKICFHSIEGYSARQKANLFNRILAGRLGLEGDEFKTCRHHMLSRLRKEAEAEEAA